MRINEITNALNTYIASVRIVVHDSAFMAKTHVVADGINQARLKLGRMYGPGNILSLSQIATKETKTLSASELQVKSLTDRAKQLNQQAKQTKARQGLENAQQALRKASVGASQIQH